MKNSENNKVQSLKTDIVVVGGGGAGMAAAVQAAEDGASVVVLEKRVNLGGNTAMAHGFFASNSPMQRKMKLDAPNDELFKLAMDYHHWTINPKLVRAFMNKSAETATWLQKKGLEIVRLPSMSPAYLYHTFHMADGPTGSQVIKILKKDCEDLGVEIIRKCTVKNLSVDDKGRINGVLAEREGESLKIEAKAVIITTGGYGGNEKLMKEHCPGYGENTRYFGAKELTGDGLLMAMEMGAATEGTGLPHYWGPFYSGANAVNLIAQRPEAIWVNRNGERYCDENIVAYDMGLRGTVIDRQPRKLSFIIFDKNIRKLLIDDGPVGAQMALRWNPMDITWAEVMEKLDDDADREDVKISDSLDEIAAWMEASPDTLKTTIDEYNADCDLRYDSVFLKDRRFLEPLRQPPYYAIRFHQALLDTMGGIKANHRMEIVDRDEKAISGLYGAGVCVGGFQSEAYCFMLSGAMFGFALNSGRIAAENAVKAMAERE